MSNLTTSQLPEPPEDGPYFQLLEEHWRHVRELADLVATLANGDPALHKMLFRIFVQYHEKFDEHLRDLWQRRRGEGEQG